MRVRIGLLDTNRHWNAPTLSEAMAKVRQFAESQKVKER